MLFNEVHDIVIGRDHCARQCSQVRQKCVAMADMAEGNFPDDKRMGQHFVTGEERRKDFVRCSQMVDPHGGVDQYHPSLGRRRGAALAFGSLPPSSASRRAASRSTNFLSAKRMIAVFSCNPLYVRAFAINS